VNTLSASFGERAGRGVGLAGAGTELSAARSCGEGGLAGGSAARRESVEATSNREYSLFFMVGQVEGTTAVEGFNGLGTTLGVVHIARPVSRGGSDIGGGC